MLPPQCPRLHLCFQLPLASGRGTLVYILGPSLPPAFWSGTQGGTPYTGNLGTSYIGEDIQKYFGAELKNEWLSLALKTPILKAWCTKDKGDVDRDLWR